MRIASGLVITGTDAPGPATLVIEDGRIAAIHRGIAARAEVLDGVLVPGFVDTHCHGGAGADFTSTDPKAVRAAVDVHRRHGSTTIFASTVTASMDDVVTQIGRLRPLVERGELGGIHLEGPFLADERKGAHDASLFCDPTTDCLDLIAEAACGSVRMITLAPERHQGLEAVRWMAEHDIVPAFGHSDADAATTARSIDAGATVATHLFNAMRSVHHREPGPVPVLLTDPRVAVELICDGVHLAPEVVALAVAAAGPGRTILVTDAMSAAGHADGHYVLGNLDVEVRDGTARLVTPDGTPGAIAGSTLTMAAAVEFCVSTVGLPLVDVVQMASVTPARVHGLDEVGVLAPGRWADACLLDEQGRLRRVLRRGVWL